MDGFRVYQNESMRKLFRSSEALLGPLLVLRVLVRS